MTDAEAADRAFLVQAGRALRRLMEYEDEDAGEPIGPIIRAHLGQEGRDLPLLTEQMESWELPGLHLALDAMLARPGWSARVLGISGEGKRYTVLGLSDLIAGEAYRVGPPELVNAPVGPSETLACLDFAAILISGPAGPACLFVRRGDDHGPVSGLAAQAVAPSHGAAGALLADLRAEMERLDVYRGQVITIEVTRTGDRRLAFLERPRMDRSEVVLPEGALDRIERHVAGPTRHREALLDGGRHLSRGLLLWGPPGTGKTHTVRYLVGRLSEATIILLSGASLGMVGAFGGLARRLAPSVVVLEDVDLVAEERYSPFGGGGPVLFELMNEMSGLGEDADVAFVLTTNRPDALEPALAARPGRGRPGRGDPPAGRGRAADAARPLRPRARRAHRGPGRGRGADRGHDGVVLPGAAPQGRPRGGRGRRRQVTDADLAAALDDLLADRSALTRVVLSGRAPRPGEDEGALYPHSWLRASDAFGLEELG